MSRVWKSIKTTFAFVAMLPLFLVGVGVLVLVWQFFKPVLGVG